MNLVEAEILALFDDTTSNGINLGTPKATINTFFQGEVFLPAKHNLPMLMVFGTDTEQTAKGTAKDQVVYTMTIRVIVDVVTQFTSAGTDGIIGAQYLLREIMEKRDTTGLAAANSVIGILRRHIKGTNFLFNDRLKVKYKMIQQNEFFYVSADLTVNVTTDEVLRR